MSDCLSLRKKEMLEAISPIDGRYQGKTSSLKEYFSEYALIKYRVKIECLYLLSLNDILDKKYLDLKTFQSAIKDIYESFSIADAEKIKATERITNHDVKAVEYFVKEKLEALGLGEYNEWVHFALTSQDINNTAVPLSISDFLKNEYLPQLNELIGIIRSCAQDYKYTSLLARTHGQAASPTTMGKEFAVFVERLEDQKALLVQLPIKAKFGGATGNFNAHKVSLPQIYWPEFADKFVKELGLQRSATTTQIAHYDHLAAIFQTISRINTILIDFARDIWTYISMDYFKQKTIANEVGSSAMPHKVNPIDFENAEGNLGMSNAVFQFLANKLPISRLQRDLTDSTVLRNVGVPFGHSQIAFLSLKKGISKLLINETKIKSDLDANWAVVAEAIQNILRREAYPKPYEALKALTRGKATITKEDIHTFIQTLDVKDNVKSELMAITPFNYIGYAAD